MPEPALDASALQQRLAGLLSPSLTAAEVAALATPLADAPHRRQMAVLHWADVISHTNLELARVFVQHAPDALRRMDDAALEDWIGAVMDAYDQEGLPSALGLVQQIEAFAGAVKTRAQGVALVEVEDVLRMFVTGLSGRTLPLQVHEQAHTDTTNLFLPPSLAPFSTPIVNFYLYEAMVAHQWAQIQFGTFSFDFSRLAADFSDTESALRLFHALETVRLDSGLARLLPGLHRRMQKLRDEAGEDPYPHALGAQLERLRRPDATVEDTYAIVRALDGRAALPAACYQGVLRPQSLAPQQHQDPSPLKPPDEGQSKGQSRPEDSARALDSGPAHSGEASSTPSESINGLVLQALSQKRSGAKMESVTDGSATSHTNAAGGAHTEEGRLRYDEWDYRRGRYRKGWCSVYESAVRPVDEPFVSLTLAKYAGLTLGLRKTFERLRDQYIRQRQQNDGDEIDLNAVVEAQVDRRAGREMTSRLFLQSRRLERDVAVMFMIDMSGSTKGWVNNAARESLVLMCEALEVLRDRYAVYGFSGITHQRCEIFRVKGFDEPYSDIVRGRITGIRPRDYTRMGVAVRHLSRLLHTVAARTKLLITLSDGRPEDGDGYGGDYGIEDTRRALFEAKHSGIRPFCITIDHAARTYLPHMYGAANYVLIDDVRQLPVKTAHIYRRLST